MNAILSQVLTEKGGELQTTNPPTELLGLPHNVQRNIERLPAAIEQPENEGFRGWFDVILSKSLGNALAEKPVASEKIEKVTVD